MSYNRLLHRFKKSWDRLWYWEKRLGYIKFIGDYRKLLTDLNDARKLLEAYRIDYEAERKINSALRMFIESKLKSPPKITYVCKHCDFRGKEYRDFCPGCGKDDSGKRSIDYYNTQK